MNTQDRDQKGRALVQLSKNHRDGSVRYKARLNASLTKMEGVEGSSFKLAVVEKKSLAVKAGDMDLPPE